MDSHILELKGFTKERVMIRFLRGRQVRNKRALILKFSGFRIFLEGLNDPSGRTYRIPTERIIEVKSLENERKIWRK